MKIAKTTLTDSHLVVTLGGGSAENRYDVRAVYIDKASNYGNAYSSQASKHTWRPEYIAVGNLIKITIPTYAPTFFTFTIMFSNEIIVGMYLNEFSLFKAKSKYLQVFDACCVGCCSHNSVCVGCDEKRKRYSMITYMLRLNLFKQSYINGNVELSTKYYVDACRIYNMDDIYFEYVDFIGTGNTASPNLYKQFDTLNKWIKNNSQQCEKRVLEALLIADLYSLLFGGEFDKDEPDTPDIPTDNGNMYYGYLTMSDIAEFKKMFTTTHDFSLLKPEEVLKGVQNKTVIKDELKAKWFNITNIPAGQTCVFVLIPASSSKKATVFDGISQFVPFAQTEENRGFESNGQDTITIDNVSYKIYGNNRIVAGEDTIKVI